jgi:FkbM family methyltransferase
MNFIIEMERMLGHIVTERIFKGFRRRFKWNVPESYPKIMETKIAGFPLRIKYFPHNPYIGNAIFFQGIFEGQFLRLVSRLLRPGMNFIDIGANCGSYTLIAAQKIGFEGKVFSFEPQPDLVAVLQDSLKINNLKNVRLFNCALSDIDGTMQLYYPSGDNKNNESAATIMLQNYEETYQLPINVEVKVLSDLCFEHFSDCPYGVKIDVEGAEYNVLAGADRLFQKNKPEFIFLECIDMYLKRFGKSDKELFLLLNDYDYLIMGYFEKLGKFVTLKNFNEYVEKSHRTDQLLAILPSSEISKMIVNDVLKNKIKIKARNNMSTERNIKKFPSRITMVIPWFDQLKQNRLLRIFAKPYRIAKRLFIRPSFHNISYFRIENAKKYRNAYIEFGDKQVEESTCLEFGAGYEMLLPLCMGAWGFKKIYAVDIKEGVNPELLNRAASFVKIHACLPNLLYPPPNLRRFTYRNFRQILLSDYRIEYSAPCDMQSTPFDDESIDYIYANAVLEHVPWEMLQNILNECHRILTPNGIMAFEIDYRDHAWDKKLHSPYKIKNGFISPYHFLQYSTEEWNQYTPCEGHHNRKRHIDYEKLFLHTGFNIIINDPVSPLDSSFTPVYQTGHEMPSTDQLVQSLCTLQLSEEFKTYTLEELAILTGFWVLNKKNYTNNK